MGYKALRKLGDKMTITAVIFDLDGVLVSTDRFHYQAWKAVADDLGVPFNEEVNHQLRGVSRMDSLNIILNRGNLELSDDEKEDIAEEKNRLYLRYLESMSNGDVDNNVLKVLTTLRNRGYKLAIGSSSKNAQVILKKTNLTNYFDAISDGNNIEKSKPHPEVFLKASEFLMEEPKKCLVVEDAESGVIAAKEAEMPVVAINYSGENALPNRVITSLDELLYIVEEV